MNAGLDSPFETAKQLIGGGWHRDNGTKSEAPVFGGMLSAKRNVSVATSRKKSCLNSLTWKATIRST